MTLLVATIPEDPAELASWLERRLVGLELDLLVAELSAIHKPARAPAPALRDVLAGQLDQVRSFGLACLSREQLRQLLTRPGLLLELQAEGLSSGGPYWDQIARTLPAMHLRVEEGRKRLPSLPRSTAPTRTLAPAAPSGAPWYRQAWFASLATAAAMLVAVGTWSWVRPKQAVTQAA